MTMRTISLLFVTVLAAGCASNPSSPFISLPLSRGWYDGEQVYYITTDISDPPMAQGAQINLAPRLRDAIPNYPKDPGTKDVLERVYKFPNNEQDAVFASIPRPLGANSTDERYSPLWLLYAVHWINAVSVKPLISEEEILMAEAQHKVTVTRTAIVINCPIVGTAREGALPGTRIHR